MTVIEMPGVYVVETTSCPGMGDVATAVPAFIGFTERAPPGGVLRLFSMQDYTREFGGPHVPAIEVSIRTRGSVATVSPAAVAPEFRLPHAVLMFFQNGGGQCLIASAGGFDQPPAWPPIAAALARVKNITPGPTLLVCPDAVGLGYDGFSAWSRAALAQCAEMTDRFAILDTPFGSLPPDAIVDPPGSPGPGAAIDYTRSAFGTESLQWGASYYPDLVFSEPLPAAPDLSNVQARVDGGKPVGVDTLKTTDPVSYDAVAAWIASSGMVMPPSGAIAGIYTDVDNQRGVWTAPANRAVDGVLRPVVPIDDDTQGGLNVDPSGGKSIDVIRTFTGLGTLVWGARTLAGNDPDWRYVPVRRFVIMVEQSIQTALPQFVFQPNTEETWAVIRGTVSSYLTTLWRSGALQGAMASVAFSVQCGLGTTMTAQDILDGRLVLRALIAVTRPGEFVALTFTQQMTTG